MDLILCKYVNFKIVFPIFSNIFAGTHWNCLIEAMCSYNMSFKCVPTTSLFNKRAVHHNLFKTDSQLFSMFQ